MVLEKKESKKAFIHIDINKTKDGMRPNLKSRGIDQLSIIGVMSLMQRSIENGLLNVSDGVIRKGR